jgi:peptidoglycan/LPS O-acetylase OafA/YrhL
MSSGIVGAGRLTWLQALRFIAALLVLLQHSLSIFIPMSFDIGLSGVLLFFTISGYVVTGLLESDPVRYAVHRFLRIYPAYVVSIILAAIVLGTMHVVPFSQMDFPRSMTLLPLWGPLSVWSRVPYWTLLYEMVFYGVIFVFVCIGPRFFNLFLVLWAGLIVLRNFEAPISMMQWQNTSPWVIFTSHLSMCFIIGAALQRLHRTGATWPAALVLVAAFAPEAWFGKESACLGVLFAATIHLSVLLEKHVKAPKALTWLGDRSYGLYLAHNPGLAFMLTFPINLLPKWLFLTVLSAGGFVIGVAYGHVEFSFYKWVTRGIDHILRQWAPVRPADPMATPTAEAGAPSRV